MQTITIKCLICAERITDVPRHSTAPAIRHLDEKHPGWSQLEDPTDLIPFDSQRSGLSAYPYPMATARRGGLDWGVKLPPRPHPSIYERPWS